MTSWLPVTCGTDIRPPWCGDLSRADPMPASAAAGRWKQTVVTSNRANSPDLTYVVIHHMRVNSQPLTANRLHGSNTDRDRRQRSWRHCCRFSLIRLSYGSPLPCGWSSDTVTDRQTDRHRTTADGCAYAYIPQLAHFWPSFGDLNLWPLELMTLC